VGLWRNLGALPAFVGYLRCTERTCMALQFWSVVERRRGVDEARQASPSAGAYGVGILCWLLSAGVYIAVKSTSSEMPPWALCFWRVTIAALILLPFTYSQIKAAAATLRKRWAELLAIGGLGLALTQGLIFVGLNYTSAINAGLILALMPVITMVLAEVLLREPMGPWQAVGSVVACIGMVIIVVRGDLFALLHFDFNAGDLFIVGGALCFALYTVLLRRAKLVVERLPLLVVLLAAAAITALPFYAWELLHDERAALTPAGLLGLAYAAVPGGALMYYLFNWSVEKLGASKAGTLLYSQTVFIAVLAYIFLGERLHFYHIVGAGFILAGVLLVMLLRPPPVGSTAGPSKAER
jgi:drug/metabolite transporter (DMT)-like permease